MSSNGNGRALAIEGIAGIEGESYEQYGYIYSGGPDVNPALSGRAKYAVYQEMRRSDAAVRSLLWMYKLPIRSAIWDLSPASDDPEDVLIAEAIAWQFGLQGYDGRLDLSWDQQLQQKLLKLDWGAIYEELIWAEPETVKLGDREVLIRPLARLAPRSPSTIYVVVEDAATGSVAEIRQDLPGARPIPGEKLAWYILDKEGKNWYGTSLLRSVYGPWRMKKALLISSAIAWDRHAAGVPKVRYPESGGAEAQRRAKDIGRSIRTHERAYVALPASDEWDVEILNGASSISDPTHLLKHYDMQIAMAGLQQFSSLGQTDSGSRAVGHVQVGPFYMAVQALAAEIAVSTTKLVFRKFVDVNFGVDKELPELTVSKIEQESIYNLATAVYDLAQAGLSFTDRDVQNDIRDRLQLPEMPEELLAGDEPGAIHDPGAGEPPKPPPVVLPGPNRPRIPAAPQKKTGGPPGEGASLGL